MHSRALIAAALVLAGVAAGPTPARAAASLPTMRSGHGITVTAEHRVDARRIDLTVTSTAVAGSHQVYVLLPEHYRPAERYPVLYLLHGALDTPGSWLTDGDAENLTAGRPLITVIPDGGLKGWYTDWAHPRGAAPQRWETFHVDQLIPFVDDNLNTIANRRGRAIAGLSMGGFGAMRYAARHPGLFAYAASFSGALDLLDPAVRATIVAEELGVVPNSGPPAAADAIFGSPLIGLDGGWRAASPVRNAASLRGMGLAIYTGGGSITDPFSGIVESDLRGTARAMHRSLNAAGIPHFFDDYGDGRGYGPGRCDGNHDFGCWKNDLVNVLPRLMAAVSHPRGAQ
ncbi:alpha/beta hydrolase [Actinoallomurus sp. CA-142502]|uniref:alpha/beta hydrolase n=1 Tax=Actinoallomurus sp. CA-142502 TaxID=3239885 RepID=UPI003D931645